MTSRLILGDCRSELAKLPSDSIDTCITDPPYGLSDHGDVSEVLRAWLAGEPYKTTKKGFMGKEWDAFVPGPEVWREVYRVLKPGAFCLVFAGTRSADLMTLALRLAGFEIRDCMMWLYGSGYPKSLDISKAIDKRGRRDYVMAAVRLGMTIPGNNLHDWTKAEHSPGDEWWEEFKRVVPADDWQRIEREVIATGHRKTDRDAMSIRLGRKTDEFDITAPATEAAKLWDGWGTALKPAWEPIIVAMKPCDGTFAENALQHGVAGLHIDGGRIHTAGSEAKEYKVKRLAPGASVNRDGSWKQETEYTGTTKDGRFPANLVLDEEAAGALDEQSGTLTSGKAAVGGHRRNGDKFRTAYGTFKGESVESSALYGDSGGASRFFYCAKASKSDRGDGNAHPTVKPLKLIEYLCRLTKTPAGGTVLDPFLGSGTTAVACARTGRPCIGIELSEEYLEIARKRLDAETPTLFGTGGVE